VHLLFGIAGIAMARTRDTAKNYLLWGGVIYLDLWTYGLLIDHDSDANFAPVNDANNCCTWSWASAWSPSHCS
jgi:hypothetical protein